MSEQEPNPYESPRSEVPPVDRLGIVGRVVGIAVVAVAAILSFCICFYTVCLAGFMVGGQPPYGVPGEIAFWFIVVGSFTVATAAAVFVARRLGRRVLSREKTEP